MGFALGVRSSECKRFKILRLVQFEPYIIADAVPYDDDFAKRSMDEELSEAEQCLLDSWQRNKRRLLLRSHRFTKRQFKHGEYFG